VCVRGSDNGKIIEQNAICSCISRVLSAKNQWNEVLQKVHDPELKVIISNTTEVGLQFVSEQVFDSVPSSFPGKLLAVLHERFKVLQNEKLIVIPTELISDNGERLRSIIIELAACNSLGQNFMNWLDANVKFCNSLVDRIVTKDPGEALLNDIQQQLGYNDQLLTMCEDYRLWAIEGDDEVKKIPETPFAEWHAYAERVTCISRRVRYCKAGNGR
jgi:tagaturonate reductase